MIEEATAAATIDEAKASVTAASAAAVASAAPLAAAVKSSEAEEADLEQPCGDVADTSSAKSTATMKVAPTAAMGMHHSSSWQSVTTAMIVEMVTGAAS